MARCKTIKVEENVIKDFVELSKKEGRHQGKMLEILIETYLKLQEEKGNEQ